MADNKNVVHFCKFKFKCDKTWDELQDTANSKIKHCNQCQKNVHQILTQNELDEAIKNELCVAIWDAKYAPHMTVGLPDTPYDYGEK